MTTTVRMKHAVWLFLLESDISLEELLQDVRIPLDSKFLVAQDWDDYVLLLEVYHISDRLQKHRFGTWRASSGLQITTGDDFSDLRSNLQGIVIHASAVQV
jgi:hypothetical protein